MRVKCRWWNFMNPAADGSVMSQSVFEQYLRSDEYRDLIESGNTLSSLTHRSRDLKCTPPSYGNLKGTIGKDDALLILGEDMPSPTHKIERLYAEDGWACADIQILNEEGADKEMAENIKRLKTLIRQGVYLPCSAVILAYWDNQGGTDVCKKIQSIKGIDITLNPSQKGARITEILSDEVGSGPIDTGFSPRRRSRVKVFSDTSAFPEVQLLPKSSKIDGCFTRLKIKEFSNDCEVTTTSGTINYSEPFQKNFSLTTIKERVRYAKYSPRQRFRKLVIEYRQVIKAAGGKMSEEDERILKSLFSMDVLDIMKTIYPEVMKGKQINTLIGASTLGKSVRQATQKLQMPFRQAMQEQEKNGFINKTRYQKIQNAYLEFIDSLIEEVFGPDNGNIPDSDDEDGQNID